MRAQSIHRGMWHQRVAVQHALCSDGKRRYARITGVPDTFFSQPASVSVNNKTVSGYITGCEAEDGSQDYQFRQYSYGKNAAELPPWS
jgi:hypothetical protein